MGILPQEILPSERVGSSDLCSTKLCGKRCFQNPEGMENLPQNHDESTSKIHTFGLDFRQELYKCCGGFWHVSWCGNGGNARLSYLMQNEQLCPIQINGTWNTIVFLHDIGFGFHEESASNSMSKFIVWTYPERLQPCTRMQKLPHLE